MSSTAPQAEPVSAPPRRAPLGLDSRRDFTRLWSAASLSALGSEFARIAAALLLVGVGASPLEIGLARTLEFLPIVFAPLAGIWVDQWLRRRLLIGAEIGRSAALLLLPLTMYAFGVHLPAVYALLFTLGALGVFYDIALQSYVPQVVPTVRLIEANGRIVLSEYASGAVGAGVGAALLGLIGGPAAFWSCAVAFAGAALFLQRIRLADRRPDPRAGPTFTRRDLAEGFRIILKSPLLRTLAWVQAVVTLGVYAYFALPLIFMSRELGFGPLTIGLLATLGGAGALVSAMALRALLTRWGAGRLMIFATLGIGLGIGVVATARTPFVVHAGMGWSVAVVAAGTLMITSAVTVFDAVEAGLRQAAIPSAVQGRATAPMVLLIYGTMPLGSLVGGVLAQSIGLVDTLLLLAAFHVLTAAVLAASPVRRVRESATLPL
jgi:predicted MFS family arabinose efflux permease